MKNGRFYEENLYCFSSDYHNNFDLLLIQLTYFGHPTKFHRILFNYFLVLVN